MRTALAAESGTADCLVFNEAGSLGDSSSSPGSGATFREFQRDVIFLYSPVNFLPHRRQQPQPQYSIRRLNRAFLLSSRCHRYRLWLFNQR